jgi:glutamyl-tRNA synthetase
MTWRVNKDYLAKVLPLVRKRIKKLDEVVPAIEYFFSGDLDYTAVMKELAVPEVAPDAVSQALLDYVERFEARTGWDHTMLEAVGNDWVTALGWQKKHAFMLLRVAATGRTASPPLFETMAVLGKEITRRRLRRAAEVITGKK